MKQLLICLSLFLSFNLFGQIQIDDIGDGWKCRVEQAIDVIKQCDQEKYNFLLQYCDHISFSLTPYSTNEAGHVILISQKEIINDFLHNHLYQMVHLKNLNISYKLN